MYAGAITYLFHPYFPVLDSAHLVQFVHGTSASLPCSLLSRAEQARITSSPLALPPSHSVLLVVRVHRAPRMVQVDAQVCCRPAVHVPLVQRSPTRESSLEPASAAERPSSCCLASADIVPDPSPYLSSSGTSDTVSVVAHLLIVHVEDLLLTCSLSFLSFSPLGQTGHPRRMGRRRIHRRLLRPPRLPSLDSSCVANQVGSRGQALGTRV